MIPAYHHRLHLECSLMYQTIHPTRSKRLQSAHNYVLKTNFILKNKNYLYVKFQNQVYMQWISKDAANVIHVLFHISHTSKPFPQCSTS